MTVDDLMIPGIPQSVRDTYLGLADEARTREFGLLEEDVVVLDTETTGLSFSNCELIEVAAARLSGREVTGRFHALVRPSSPIPPEIERLTGITNEDVSGAEGARKVVSDLAGFVGGDPVLAHNATFDRTFVEKVPGGREVSDLWVDTLALSRIALPALANHRLSAMAEAFGCASVSHRAMDDVDALAGMWRIILCGLVHLPEGMLGLLADMHPEVEWAYRPILSHLALESAGAPLSLVAVRKQLATDAQIGMTPHKDVEGLHHDLVAPSAADVAAGFSSDGVVGRMYADYEPRPEQVAMAEEVRMALSTSTHRAIEAGTGVGKSVAYLLPLSEFAKANDITVGVATKTNALTDQLVSHELPALAAQVPGGLTFCALKGYDHYPCLRRLERACLADLPDPPSSRGRAPRGAKAEMLTAIATTYAYAAQVVDGDLDGLGIRWRCVPRRMLTVTSNECTHHRCPYYPDGCMLHGARRRASASDVVVTNHSLLLRNVEADGKILPPIRHWVIDEAHGFEAEARRQWAAEVSAERAKAAFEALGGVRTGAIHSLMAQASDTEASTLVCGLLTKAAGLVSRAQVSSADLFDAIRGLSAVAGSSNGYDSIQLWIGPDVRATPEWAAVAEASHALADRLDACVTALDAASASLADAVKNPSADLDNATCTLRELLGALRLVESGEDDSYVFSAQLSRSTARIGTERLVAEKLDVGAELSERWLPEMRSVTFTSATIAVGEDFSHFDHAVGLDRLGPGMHRDVRLDSSYDFDDHMGVVVCSDLPDPRDPLYASSLVDLLFDVHVAMDGSVLTLFTARRDMERAYGELAPRLAEKGLELACQDRQASVRQVRERFLSEDHLSLMALRSFWEGFDAAGDTLRCVVIPRLPFASPNDPLSRERDAREPRAWWRYSLPESVISVKQAAGRLIRTSSDTGVLVLADSRLVTKRYGSAFTRSLPTHDQSTLPASEVGEFIRTWRQEHEG
ncbi:MAG: DNA polymerase III subunit epsilon [Atopobiaceae bacterium]|jgi:ATP-dependent DNA helicase DinG|nr:DNA polymerase III subunit epsilon [Atopobiaceae bacterium]